MMKVITDPRTIRKCQDIFYKTLLNVCSEKISCVVTDKSTRNPQLKDVLYSPSYNFWYYRYQDGVHEFGINKPKGNVSPTVYFNIPKSTAVYGQERSGEYTLLHSGRIGGGKPGIGKNLLFENYSNKDAFVTIDNNGKENEFVLIDKLNSISLPKKVSEFIYEVHRIKSEHNEGNDKQTGGFPEGKKIELIHKGRERNSKVMQIAKNDFIKKHGKLFCEVCNFNFEDKYGQIGKAFIEGHHTIAVRQMQPNHKTKPEDIAMLCSNCHRMIHKRRPWLTKKNIKKLIE